MTDTRSHPADELAVCRTLCRFAAAVDLRDWTAYRDVFTDEIDLDYSSYRPGSAGRFRADDWVERAERFSPAWTRLSIVCITRALSV
jgi:hypothetical protein